MANKLENEIRVDGTLGKDAEFRYTSSGKRIVKFSICYNTSKKVGDQWEKVPHWFDCTYWHDSEQDNDILVKGQLIKVIGSLQQEKWTSEGNQRSKVSINVHSIQVLDKDEVFGKRNSQPSDQSTGYPNANHAEQFEDDEFSDIPFS